MVSKRIRERDRELQLARPMTRPMDLQLPDGDIVRIDGDRVLEAALQLIRVMHCQGQSYRWDFRFPVMEVLSAMLPLAWELNTLDRVIASRTTMGLMIALEDLERGRVPELLRPAKPKRRSRASRREWYLRAFAAGCLEVLIAAQMPDEEAKHFVGHILAINEFPLGRISTPPALVVADWRKRFRENNKLAPDDYIAYLEAVEGQKASEGEALKDLKSRIELALTEMLRLVGYARKGIKLPPNP